MKSIIICCSISAAEEVIKIREKLETLGFDVIIPLGVQQYIDRNFTHKTRTESAKDKKEMDLITRYYKKYKKVILY